MKNVTQSEGGFLVNLEALVALRIGDQQGELAPQATTKSPTTSAEPLLARSRGAFIQGLFEILARGNPALLCAPRALLSSIEGAPTHRSPNWYKNAEGHYFVPAAAHLIEVLTSGSTGNPQVHQKSAGAILSEALVLAQLLKLARDDTVIATTASHHLYGLLFGVLAPWTAGASIVTDSRNEADAFHPEGIGALCREVGATLLITVPAHLRSLTEAGPDLGTLRGVVCSAAPLAPEDARRFEKAFSIPVLDVLGSTETGGIATRWAARNPKWSPLPGVDVKVDDQQRLLISSPFLTGGSSVVTGEKARLDADGRFEYLGRDDGVVKVGGKRVHLREIEAAARSVAGVTEAHAISRQVNSMRGHEVLLVVQARDLRSVEIKHALRSTLDPTFVPRRIRVVEQMPIDERGKLTRALILSLFQVGHNRGFETASAPSQSTSTEPTIIHIPADSPRFLGHFPDAPVYPGVATLLDLVLPKIKDQYGYEHLSSLRRVKWLRPLEGGMSVSLLLSESTKSADTVRFELVSQGDRICQGLAQFAAIHALERSSEEPK